MDKPPFRVIICGGRDFTDDDLLVKTCDYQLQNKMKTHKVIIVCGRAKGADTLGAHWAENRGLQVENYPADWNKYGKRAGILRNMQMGDIANACIAFPGGTGTAHMISYARERGLIIRVVEK